MERPAGRGFLVRHGTWEMSKGLQSAWRGVRIGDEAQGKEDDVDLGSRVLTW